MMAVPRFALGGSDFAFVPINMLTAGMRIVRAARIVIIEDDSAAGDVEAINNNETARGRSDGVHVKNNRRKRMQPEIGNFMRADENGLGIADNRLKRRRIYQALNGIDPALDLLGGDFEFVMFAFGERLFAEPKHAGFEAGQFAREVRQMHANSPPLDEYLFLEGNSH